MRGTKKELPASPIFSSLRNDHNESASAASLLDHGSEGVLEGDKEEVGAQPVSVHTITRAFVAFVTNVQGLSTILVLD